jgi:hypothetical protein
VKLHLAPHSSLPAASRTTVLITKYLEHILAHLKGDQRVVSPSGQHDGSVEVSVGLNARKTVEFSWMRMGEEGEGGILPADDALLCFLTEAKTAAGAKRSCFFSPKQKKRDYSRRKMLKVINSFGVSTRTFHERV